MAQEKFDLAEKLRAYKHPTLFQLVWMGAGLALAVASFIFLSGFVACWRLTALPGIPLPACSSSAPATDTTPGATLPPGVTPTSGASVPQVELPPPWDGASRVNILLMGYDYGDWSSERQCPCRTDTMMVLTIDPLSHTAGALSIPRDMWVSIPGFDSYNKINTANFLGDSYKLPGGGAELARKTVENFLGIPIQYYVMVDFNTFVTMIDTIGGICLVIPEDITIDPLGHGNTEHLPAGPDCFNGAETLAYARMRYTANDDMDRAARQQQVILAIRDKLLSPGNFVNLVAQAPTLYQELSGGFETNLPLNDALQLAVLAMEIPLDQIHMGILDYTMSAPAQITVNGTLEDILRPYPDKIREEVETIFGSGAMQPMATGDDAQKMQEEAASVFVINGSDFNGLASSTADYLKSQGMDVVGIGSTGDYPGEPFTWPPLPDRSMFIVHAGKPYTAKYLMALMGYDSQNQLVVAFDPNAPADIVLVVGNDWANTMP